MRSIFDDDTVLCRPGGARWRAVALAVAVMLLSGCAGLLPADTQQVDVGSRVSLQPLLDTDAIAIPGIRATEVVDVVGEPSETVRRRPPKPERPGEVVILRYDGLEVVVRELERPPRAFISDLVLTSDDYATTLPVGVGSSRADIEDVLGEPSETEGDEAVYQLSERGDRIIVVYEGDRAARMAFQFS